ncbi:unnamed protein product [Rotaria socialis]|uniref:Uncharacterized protein n=1 Tax=Rotaria socialis TaxID=392032 RepID=A0A819BXK4_9BILA|nr:unnamed protein product [Rotaria socialis]CAF3603402.1 unnamed protein product [Rotaria socialis]CAF3603720.1 unnamed protein product [Rotaria socialis]CAF3610465.1 unnamed protein product [Rotaria socialis]CAF3809637.1 unnamed protein product [Rotaria socialis]
MGKFELVTIPSTDIEYVIERLKNHEKMTHEEAVKCVQELIHFYTAIKYGKRGSPSDMIDKAWHAHILNTPMYMEFTQATFGRFVHHVPYWSGHQSDGTEDDIYKYLISLLGVDHVDATVWGQEEINCVYNEHSSDVQRLEYCQKNISSHRQCTTSK